LLGLHLCLDSQQFNEVAGSSRRNLALAASAFPGSTLAFACSTVSRAAFALTCFNVAKLAAFFRSFVGVNDSVAVLVEFGEQLRAERPFLPRQYAVAVFVTPDIWRAALVLAGALHVCTAFARAGFSFATGRRRIPGGRAQARQAKGQRCDDYDSLHVVFLSVVSRFVRRFSEGIRLP
jgi:hypothetical protein